MGLGAFEHRDRQAPTGYLLLADALGGRQIHPGLSLVGQPQHGRAGAGLRDRPQRVGAGGEIRERPRLVTCRLRHGVHAHPYAGDHAESALGAEQHLTQVGARSRGGSATQVQGARRGDRAQPADHVVEAAVARRILAGRAGGSEAADGREAEALREMPEREAALAQQPFGVRSGHPGSQLGLPGHLVEPPQSVHPAQVQRHHGLEPPARRVEAADHRGAATEGNHGDAPVGAEPQHRGHVVVAAGQQHRVGCVLDAEVATSQQVQRRLAAGAQ